jgi:adenosylcobinamide kinase/adenosylcobinamide-phosphate guanylyltransferase
MPDDDEMKERVLRHQAERGSRWKTVEAPIRLAQAISDVSPAADVIVADCITLWISNLMMDPDTEDVIEDHIEKLSASLAHAHCPVIIVTNEVGAGVVPDNRLARRFRDLVGTANQNLARVSDRVVWVVAGIPVEIKGENKLQGP